MFDIKADIQLTDRYRKQSIRGNTYRPLIFFGDGLIRSGLLKLAKKEYLEMNGQYRDRIIGIYFYDDDFAEKIYVGQEIILAEGSKEIGYGRITEILGASTVKSTDQQFNE